MAGVRLPKRTQPGPQAGIYVLISRRPVLYSRRLPHTTLHATFGCLVPPVAGGRPVLLNWRRSSRKRSGHLCSVLLGNWPPTEIPASLLAPRNSATIVSSV